MTAGGRAGWMTLHPVWLGAILQGNFRATDGDSTHLLW